MDAATEAVRKLRHIMEKTGWKQTEISNRIGCTQASVSRWLAKNPKEAPNRDSTASITKLYNEMFAGELSSAPRAHASSSIPSGDVENLKSNAGGGGMMGVDISHNGDLVDPAISDGFWSFPDSIKSGWRGLSRIKAFPVIGDSMEPTLSGGSTVFIDTSHTYPSPEDIYCIDAGDGLVIKRVVLVPRTERLLIISDNKDRYGDPCEIDRQDVRVFGRVVAWFQRRG
jgi:transcriptional regulator with XRE-family HTH domain